MLRCRAETQGILRPVAQGLCWLVHQARHALPVALFLACALSALGPDALRGTETLMMRAVYFFDLPVASFFQQATVDAQLKLPPAGTTERLDVSVVMLTPEAYSKYLLRTSPAPRARLACLLLAFAEALEGLPPPEKITRPPVIGIDIDITPLEASPSVWHPVGDERACHDALLEQGLPVVDKKPGPLTYQAAVVRAIARLADKNCVVAIAFGHPGEAASVRKSFIDDVQKAHRQEWPCSDVLFVSSELLQIPHEYVHEYATSKRSFAALPRKLQGDLGRYVHAGLPEESCSLGRVLGARLRSLRHPEDKSPCLAPSSLEAVVELEASAYATRPIDLGPARAQIAYSAVDPPRPVAPNPQVTSDKPRRSVKPRVQENLRESARQAFDATLQPSDLYIVTADSGTTADKFMVPVVERPVPGAWVHAAIALTELAAGQEGEKAHESQAVRFLAHAATDVGWALLFVFAANFLLEAGRAIGSAVAREIAVSVVPALVLGGFVLLFLRLAARNFAAGHWSSPALLLVGMTLHLYVDLAASSPPPAAGADHARCDCLRPALQWIWCVVLAALILLGVWPTFRDAIWSALAAPLALGTLYLAFAMALDFLPLPWRIHAPHPAHPHHD